ncbi:MAG: HAD family hydrolase [Planctomycetes bacterium]|nr:HAD family hydrolase [Planctomycetota bacterium]
MPESVSRPSDPEPALGAAPIEIIRGDFPRGAFRAVIFDFDGTLSLLRRNWQDVMIPMMVEILAETGTGESSERLGEVVEDFVMRLNGKQTIYQMIQLRDEVTRRGGAPLDPLDYKRIYHDRLYEQVGVRVEAVRSGRVPAETMTVPGTRRLLESLTERGLALYLASGTDLAYVRDEADLLGVGPFFGERIFGALDDYRKFSKQMIIQRMIAEMDLDGSSILGIGDGFVEIEEVKRVGGAALGVASNEETRTGVNAWKRARLIRAGADLIIGDYRAHDALLRTLGLE